MMDANRVDGRKAASTNNFLLYVWKNLHVSKAPVKSASSEEVWFVLKLKLVKVRRSIWAYLRQAVFR
jgi:hypothetical protein